MSTALELAEMGIEKSHQHAEQVDEGWSARAVDLVKRYADLHGEFLTEEAKAWAYAEGLPEPPVDGAWGHVMRRAARFGHIHRHGERPATSPGSHGKLMAVWRRGPAPQGQPTKQEIISMADAHERYAAQMKNEGRALFAEHLLQSAAMFRAIARA